MPVVVLFGACIGFYYLSIEPPKEEVAPAAPQVIRTRVAKLPWIDYQVNVTTRGVVQSHNQVELHAQVSGEIVRISPNFEVGAYFKAGEILAEISSRDYQIAVEAAKARCDGAAANLSLATRNVERNERLSVENAISRAELDELIATQELMAAELESAEAQLERARRDLERTMIVAPYDGRVLQRTVSRGQAVAVGTVLGTVFSTDYAEVRLPIAAKDLRFLDLPESEEDPPLSVELRDR
jgi:RND family efflux transporter MFP subunit